MTQVNKWRNVRRSLAILMLAVVSAATIATAAPKKKASSPIIPGGNSRAPISIDAQKLEFSDKEQKFVYSGNVVAKQGDATLKAPALTIYLQKDAVKNSQQPSSEGGMNDRIKRIEASGPVTITSKDQVGTGDRGVYDKAANKVYLIGHPVLSQATNIVKGSADSILEYDLASGRANIKGGRIRSVFTPGSDDKKGSGTKRRSAPAAASGNR